MYLPLNKCALFTSLKFSSVYSCVNKNHERNKRKHPTADGEKNKEAQTQT